MKSIICRPLAVFSVAFYIFSCFLYTADESVRLWSAVFSLLIFIISLILRLALKRKRSPILRTISFLLAGLSLSSFISFRTFDLSLGEIEKLDGTACTLEGTVTDIIYEAPYMGIYTVDLSRLDGNDADFSINLTTEAGLKPLDIIRCDATLYKFENNDGFAERNYNINNRIFLEGECERVEIIGRDKEDIFTLADNLNSSLTKNLITVLGERNGGFAAALLLGNKSYLAPELERDFARLGLSHILALSGMHLTVICAMITFILRSFNVKARRIACIITVVFYMLITGFSPSVTRAGIMLIILIIGAFFKRGGDSFTNLGLSVLIITLADPYSAADIGLVLSFACVFAILLYLPQKKDLFKKRNDLKKQTLLGWSCSFIRSNIIDAAILTFIIILFILPLQWMYFGTVSVVSVITSPLFSLLCTLLLWSLPFFFIFLPADIFLSAYSFIIGVYIDFICDLGFRISHIRNIYHSINYPLAPLFCLIIFLSAIFVCVMKKKKRLIAAGISLALCLGFFTYAFLFNYYLAENVKIDMLCEKSSEGLVISTDNKLMVIDVGNGHKSIAESAVVSIRNNRETEIDVYMLTHYHTAHESTIRDLFSSQKIYTLLIPENMETGNLMQIAKEYSVSLVTYIPGERIAIGNATIKTYENAFIPRSTQPIIRIDIYANDQRFCYVGGAYCEGVADLDLSDFDGIWFGDHGPLYKKDFSPVLSDDCRIFTSVSADSYYDSHSWEPSSFILGTQ